MHIANDNNQCICIGKQTLFHIGGMGIGIRIDRYRIGPVFFQGFFKVVEL